MATPEPKREKVNKRLQPWNRTQDSAGPILDVSIAPMTYIYTRYDRKQLDELATTPALQQMKIMHNELPWDIIVRSKDTRGITVRDILDTVWTQLNIPVTEEEAQVTRGHWTVMRHWDRTSDARQNGDRYAGLKRYHWMRLDRSKSKLIGLEPYREDMWRLVFEE